MERMVIAAVRFSRTDFITWFDAGVSKRISAEQIDVEPQALADLKVSDDGSGITLGDDVFIPANQLFEVGVDINFVDDEKHHILKSLSAIRREAAFSQTRLGEAAGIRQSVISRIEGCEISPQINTIIKLLAPLGKTLAIVDIDQED